jgi:hypothetical protein
VEASAAATAPQKPKKPKVPTSYTILRKQPKTAPDPSSPSAAIAGASGPDLYEIVGMQIADNAIKAIKTFAAEQEADAGVYVATPSRGWTEKTVGSKTELTVT